VLAVGAANLSKQIAQIAGVGQIKVLAPKNLKEQIQKENKNCFSGTLNVTTVMIGMCTS
jgi:hypothetical protein